MIRRPLAVLLALALAAPAWAASEGRKTLYSFVKPTDVVKVETQAASFPELTGEPTAQGEVLRRFTFTAAANPHLRLSPAKGDWNWSQASAMSLRLQNAMDWAITLEVRIESRDGRVLSGRIALPAGPAQTLLVPLAATSPRALGMRAGAPMPITLQGQRILLAETLEGELNLAQVSAVTLSMTQPDVPQSILLGRFGVQAGDAVQKAAYTGIVDAYGQYSRGYWPEKVDSDQQLREAAAREREQLKAWLAERPQQDRFGGWLGGPTFEAKGFFRTEKRDGRWYLVTPEGHPFFSLGVNAVSPYQGRTYVEGREAMFAALPGEGERLAAYYGQADNRGVSGATRGRAFAQGRWFDFYQANLQRTYAEPCVPAPTPLAATPAPAEGAADGCARVGLDAARWVGHTLDRLQAWGFNSLGNWSDDRLGQARRMPYSIPLSISGDYATISTGHDWWGGMPDPFDPRFAMAAERAIAIAARDRRDDPWLLGFFADNELAWAAPGEEPRARYALAYGTLRLSTDVPAKRAFLKQLRDKYRNQDGLSRAWGIELKAWELLEDPGFEAPLPSAEFPQIERDLQDFQRLFAETYFKTIADSLEWHAPNHLLLGGRFANATPEAVAACARYCDVLSFNLYAREPQHGYDFAALRALDKPLLISEFHFGSRDRGPFWGGLAEVAREEERGPAYAQFLARALDEPGIVGVHWFQYLDQPLTGRLLDGENGHFGLVGITDRPWPGFVERVRAANLALPGRLLGTP
ncbi:MAG: beta-agarase [Pseudomonadaceae bacterium]|nr:beta-agarase [Pseudomonadaceae bacterium]